MPKKIIKKTTPDSDVDSIDTDARYSVDSGGLGNVMAGITYAEKYGLTAEQADNTNPDNMFEKGDSCEKCGMEFSRRRNKHIHAATCGDRKPRQTAGGGGKGPQGEEILLRRNWRTLATMIEAVGKEKELTIQRAVELCEDYYREADQEDDEGYEWEDALVEAICRRAMTLKLYQYTDTRSITIKTYCDESTIGGGSGGKNVEKITKKTAGSSNYENLLTIAERMEKEKE
jgi:hypothetical protein